MTQIAHTSQDVWKSKKETAKEIGCSIPKLEKLIEQLELEVRTDQMNQRLRLVNVSELKRKLGK